MKLSPVMMQALWVDSRSQAAVNTREKDLLLQQCFRDSRRGMQSLSRVPSTTLTELSELCMQASPPEMMKSQISSASLCSSATTATNCSWPSSRFCFDHSHFARLHPP